MPVPDVEEAVGRAWNEEVNCSVPGTCFDTVGNTPHAIFTQPTIAYHASSRNAKSVSVAFTATQNTMIASKTPSDPQMV
jgi:hypothetical protein